MQQQSNQVQPQPNQQAGMSDRIGPAQPKPGSPPPNLGHNGNGTTNSNGNIRLSDLSGQATNRQQNQVNRVQVKGPAQPPAGSPPPNLGHNGNGANNSQRLK